MSAFTSEGLTELQAAVEQFPLDLAAVLQPLAEQTAQRIATRARQLLGPGGQRGVELTVVSDSANRQVRILAKATRRHAANLTLWLEYGTALRQQRRGRVTGTGPARHYMRDSAAAEEAGYRRAMETAADAVAQRVFKE